MAVDLTKFILRFVEEAREHLGKMSDGISLLADGAADASLVNSLFRSAHTIKGSARMMKLAVISETAHKMEDVLGALRDGKIPFSRDISQLLYRAIDAMARMVDCVAEKPAAPEFPRIDEDLRHELEEVLKPTALENEKAPFSGGQDSSLSAKPLHKEALPLPVTSLPDAPDAGQMAPGKEEALPPSAEIALPAVETRPKRSETVRLRLDKLDELIKLMGETVASHARMRQRLLDIRELESVFDQTGEDRKNMELLRRFRRNLTDDAQAQEQLMNELHAKVLSMRMLPLSVIFDVAGRAVREMARAQGKQAECVISGAEVELDRQMIEHLSDPVIHLLRNAVDHGLESPQQRKAAGKEATGRVFLASRQEEGRVVIEIGDDGAGIDTDAIRSKAISRGLLKESAAVDLSREDLLEMIFLPGFSTRAIITDTSGRGVGLDVVKRSIVDQLHGEVSLNSQPGTGAVFSLRLPLSLAVMRVLIVSADGCPFGFIARNVVSLRRFPEDFLVRVAGSRHAVILDNEFVPVVPLSELVRMPPGQDGLARQSSARKEKGLLLVIVQDGAEKLALLVDELLDEYDMVIKPLPEHMRKLSMVSGLVMTGKNELVSILHAPTLLEVSRRLSKSALEKEGAGKTQKEMASKARILVVDDSLTTREVFKDLLEAYHYQVTLAEDGQDGLARALTEQFDAVLTDVEMPNMDGFSLTRRLRSEEQYRHVPIVIITSREKEEDKRRGIEAGADAYIVKSGLNQGSLIDTLQAVLG